MPEKVNFYFSGSTFQNFDGTNFTTVGVEAKTNFGLAGYAGLGANFNDKSTGVFDVKYSGKFGENSVIGYNFRARTKLGENEKSTQLRGSLCSLSIPFNDNLSGYLTPCGCATHDYQTGKWKLAATMFGGVTYKIDDKTSISTEVQRYNLQDIYDNSGKNWSWNFIFSRKL